MDNNRQRNFEDSVQNTAPNKRIKVTLDKLFAGKDEINKICYVIQKKKVQKKA